MENAYAQNPFIGSTLTDTAHYVMLSDVIPVKLMIHSTVNIVLMNNQLSGMDNVNALKTYL